MLHTHIAASLPEGLSRPLYARWADHLRLTPWVRAGDLRRQGDQLEMVPCWDGARFAVLCDLATRTELFEADAQVQFAIPVGGVLEIVAHTDVTWQAINRVRAAR